MDGNAIGGTSTYRRFVAPLALCLVIAAGACSSDTDAASSATTTTARPTTTIESGSTSSTTPQADQTAPAPDSGSIDEVETDTAPGRVLDPIAFGETADLGNGVTATVTATEAIDATARQPGEISGPAVLITVDVNNGSGADIDLDYVTIDLTTSTGTPIGQVLVDPSGSFRGPLAAGATATGKYAFTIPVADRDQATLTFKYSADTSTAVFTGDLPA